MTALVLGASGQDGSYLVERLRARSREVVGAGIEARAAAPGHAYRAVDLRDRAALGRVLAEVAPDEVYHFAAVHRSAAGAPYEERFGDMLAVNVESVHVVLEHLRARGGGKLLYASSIKAFGEPPPERIDEATPRRATCLYAVTKNAAADLVGYYRRAHGVAASVIYFGNHESPRRPADFFIPKLARALAGESVSFHTLDFYCDWGSAEEYVDICVDVLERAAGEDFVMGTGRTVHARALAESLGIDPARLRVAATPSERPAPYQLDVGKLERLVRKPSRRVEDVVREIAAATRGRG